VVEATQRPLGRLSGQRRRHAHAGDDLRAQLDKVALGGGEAARAKHTARGKLLPRERVQMLLDPGTPFLELAPLAALNMYNNDAPGAGLDCRHRPRERAWTA
jgi:acetyl-CoA carboxylase carboxyltransferase component